MSEQARVTCGGLAGTVNVNTGEECDTCDWDAAWCMWGSRRVEGAMTLREKRGRTMVATGFCPDCGARLSFAPDGTPVAEAMVPREFVARMAWKVMEDPAPWPRDAGGDMTGEEMAEDMFIEWGYPATKEADADE